MLDLKQDASRISLGVAFALLLAAPSAAQDTADLAMQLANPVASLNSVPFQFNYNSGYGPNDGARAYVNILPVIPCSISAD